MKDRPDRAVYMYTLDDLFKNEVTFSDWKTLKVNQLMCPQE